MLYVYLNNNEYRVLERISENVYFVQSQTSTCCYIAKSCPKEDTHKHLFRTELNVLANLKSNFVPKIVDVFKDGNEEWLIETYIDGLNGKEWLKKHPSIWARNKCVFTILKIVNELHDLGYLYIDLKPENINVFEKNFYLIDFNACIERKATIAYRASKSNCAPELLALTPKDVEVDVYSMGSLIQSLFKHKKIIVYLCHLRKEKRIKTLKKLKQIFIGQIILRGIVFVSICCLSVFFISNTCTSQSIFDEYYKNRNVYLFQRAFEMSKKENEEDTLYQWIMKDWIVDEVYQNPQSASYLMDQAIETNNESIIRFIYEKSEKAMSLLKKKYLDMILNPNSKTIERCITSIIDSDLVLQEKINQMDECLELALNKKIVFDLKQIERFINSIDLNTSVDIDDFSISYTEYILLLRKEQGINYELPELFIQKIKNEKWNALYAIWRASV